MLSISGQVLLHDLLIQSLGNLRPLALILHVQVKVFVDLLTFLGLALLLRLPLLLLEHHQLEVFAGDFMAPAP